MNTVRYHVSNMLSKLGVPDRQALAAWRGQPAPEPSEAPRQWGGLLGLARLLGVAGVLVLVAALAWVALDRLSGRTSELPAATVEATPAEPEVTGTDDPLARDVPFATDGRYWARAIQADGGTGLESPFTVIQPNGTIVFAASVVTNSEHPTVDVGGGPIPLAGLHDIVLAALAPDGRHLWSKVVGGPGEDYPGGLALTSDGRLVLVGSFEDGMDFGHGPVHSSPPDSGQRHSLDAFVAEFSPSGQLAWVETFGTGFADWGRSITMRPDGDLMVTMSSSAPQFEIGGAVLDLPMGQENVLARLSPEGEVRWATSVSGSWYLSSLRVDPASGDLVAITWGTVRREDGEERRSPDGLIRISADGRELWRADFSSATGYRSAELEIDADGSIVVGGIFRVPVDFGGGVVEPRGGLDGYLARFSAEGEHLSSRDLGRTSDYLEALALEPNGDIWIAGGSLIERLSPDGEREAELDLGIPITAGGTTWRGGNRIDRMGTLIVEGAGLAEGEILIGGRFFDRASFPKAGDIRATHWLPNFIARIEAP